MLKSKTIHSFTTKTLPTLKQVGGKALSLIIMTQQGFSVPGGFVLAVDFFEPWLKEVKQSDAWKQFLDASEKDLKKQCDAVKKSCQSLTFNDVQKAQLQTVGSRFNLEPTTDRPPLFAVRSSSPEEDLEGTSFAGGYETTLGVTQETLEQAILDSFISVFDERIVKYKQQHGMSIDDPKIAIIVQQQIASDVSGVAFSLNPQNNCYDEAVITSNFGLGETVVAGQVTPDTYIVEKLKKEIIEKKIAEKDHALWLTETGGTNKKKNPEPSKSSLTDEQILEVTKLVTEVEKHYEKPMDIEWAYASDTLYLLQARPVTAYFPLPKSLLTDPRKPKHLYVNMGLVKQGIPGVMSTMGSSVFLYLTGAMGGFLSDILLDDPENGISAFSDGVMMTQLGNMEKMMGRRTSAAAIEIGGHSVVDTYKTIDMKLYLPKRLPKSLRVMRRKLIWYGLRQAPGILKGLSRSVLEFLKRYREHDVLQTQEHHQLLNQDFKTFNEVIQKAMKANVASLLDEAAVILAGARLAKWRINRMFKHDEVQDLLTSLEMALPGNKTSEMGQMMYELAKQPEIQQAKNANEFIKKLRAKQFPTSFLERWNNYIALHGFRGMGELDLATPRSHENVPNLFRTIKDMSKQVEKNQETTFDRAKRKREEAYQKLHALAEEKGKRAVKKLEKNYEVFLALAGLRENPKYNLIRMFDLVRKQALKFGEQLVKANQLDHREDIFNLSAKQVDRGLRDKSFDLLAQIEKNTAYAKQLGGRDIPVFLDSRGKIFYPPIKDLGENMLPGEPISPGKVAGRVKVLKTAHEKPILPGEILVAKATDPGWTPLFINAGGIILENGGPLQHGAVVAREYGKPCVTSVVNATQILKDGQLVEVDGSRGVVRILEDSTTSL